VNDDPVARKFDAAELRARYEALGAERVFFGVAAGGTLLGAVLPIVRTPMIAFFSGGSDVRFYDLGLAGWLAFLTLVVLAGAPFVRPALTAGHRAIPLLAAAGALIGVVLTLLAVSSYGFFGLGPGLYAWFVSAAALVAGYSRRIATR